MQYSSESLSCDLEQLEAIFSKLSENLAKAAEQFRQSRISPSQDLVAALSDYEKRFADLARRIVEHGKELSLSAGQLSNLSTATLDDVKRSLQVIVEIEDERTKAAIKGTAVATLDRAHSLVRRDRVAFPPLSKFQANVRAIRDAIVSSSPSELPQAARELAEGKHVISRLLDLIEHQENLTDDECLNSHEMIAESLGKDLAVAALRGKLEVPSSLGSSALRAAAEPSVESPVQNASSVSELKPLRGVSEQVSGSSSGSLPQAKADLDDEIEKFLENTTHEAGGGSRPVRTGSGDARGGGIGMSDAKGISGLKEEPNTPAAQSSTEEPYPLLLAAFEVGDSVLEAVRLEEQADLCLSQDKHSEAEAHYQQLLILQEKLFGTKDPKIAKTRQNLAKIQQIQRQRLLVDVNPKQTDGAGERKRVRIGVVAVVVLAIGISVYAAMRYRHMDAKAPAAHSLANVQEASQPARIPPPTGPSRVPDKPQPPEAVGQPKVIPKQEVMIRSAPKRVLAATSPVQQQQKTVQPNLVPNQRIVREDPPPPVVPNGMNGGSGGTGATAGSALSGLINPAVSVPPPPPPPAPPLQRLRVGGLVAAAKLVSKSTPVYPALARSNHIQGTVRLGAIIDKDGSIGNLTVISGPPLLTKAAIDAVKLWRYQPTLLNGSPVEVETTVDVNFTLSQ